jgi:hypothetical protein
MRLLITLLLQISFISILAQNVSFADLVSFINRQSWESVNQTLMNKGWPYFGSEEEGEDSYGNIQWSYGKSYYDDKA